MRTRFTFFLNQFAMYDSFCHKPTETRFLRSTWQSQFHFPLSLNSLACVCVSGVLMLVIDWGGTVTVNATKRLLCVLRSMCVSRSGEGEVAV